MSLALSTLQGRGGHARRRAPKCGMLIKCERSEEITACVTFVHISIFKPGAGWFLHGRPKVFLLVDGWMVVFVSVRYRPVCLVNTPPVSTGKDIRHPTIVPHNDTRVYCVKSITNNRHTHTPKNMYKYAKPTFCVGLTLHNRSNLNRNLILPA